MAEVPGLKSEQFATTPPRAVTTEDGPPVQERPRPRKMSRSFTTERSLCDFKAIFNVFSMSSLFFVEV